MLTSVCLVLLLMGDQHWTGEHRHILEICFTWRIPRLSSSFISEIGSAVYLLIGPPVIVNPFPVTGASFCMNIRRCIAFVLRMNPITIQWIRVGCSVNVCSICYVLGP